MGQGLEGLASSLAAHWDSTEFDALLRHGLVTRALDALALHRSSTHGGHIQADDVSISVLSVTKTEASRDYSLGVFFVEAVGGCSCADDPFRVDGYCERRVRVERTCGRLRIVLETPAE